MISQVTRRVDFGIQPSRAGRILTGLAVAFLLWDSVIKLLGLEPVREGQARLGYPVSVGDPIFTHVLFPIYVATLLWGGLYLRDARLRTVVSSNW